MSSKQDRPGLRNPADFERRYNLSERFYEQTQFNESVSCDLKAVQDSLGLHKQNTSEGMNNLQKNIKALDESLNQSEIVKRLTNNGDGLYVGEDGDIYTRASHVTGLEILQAVYPVGAIYLSTNAANLADLFGFGEWQQIKDTFLLACGNTYAAGSTGGEAEHTLTADEMPSHAHKPSNYNAAGSDTSYQRHFTTNLHLSSDSTARTQIATGSSGKYAITATTNSDLTSVEDTTTVGGSQPHNNMPPYLAVYVWQRTA